MIGRALRRLGTQEVVRSAGGTLTRPSAMDTVLTKNDAKIVYSMLGAVVMCALWTIPCGYNYAKRWQQFTAYGTDNELT